jgi:hypothetical protein
MDLLGFLVLVEELSLFIEVVMGSFVKGIIEDFFLCPKLMDCI